MQVLPTAPSPTVTHLMNLVTLMSPSPGRQAPFFSPAQVGPSPHSHTPSSSSTAASAPRNGGERAARDNKRDKDNGTRTGMVALLCFACLLREENAGHSTPRQARQRHRAGTGLSPASLKNSPLAAGLGRRGVNASPQDREGGGPAGQE
jgi:hypothetical protein